MISMSTRMTRLLAALLVLFAASLLTENRRVQAQITPPPGTSITQTQQASLADFLINRLRATSVDQRSYVQEIVRLTDRGQLDRRLLLALERYAKRKNPYFPLPVFERALRVEAAKRGVTVPLIREIVARNGASAAQAVRDSRIR